MHRTSHIHPVLGAALEAAIAQPVGPGPLELSADAVSQPQSEIGNCPATAENLTQRSLAEDDAQSAYRDLIADIACEEPLHGFTEVNDIPVDLLAGNDEAVAVVCDAQAAEVTNEVALDPTLYARFMRKEVSAAEVLRALREAFGAGCARAALPDVQEKCSSLHEAAYERSLEGFYGGSGPQSDRERLEVELGVRSLFR